MGTGTAMAEGDRITSAKMNLKLEIVDHANKKLRGIVALADEDKTLTGVQMADKGTFTITPTVARTLTTDTAANIIAAVPGATADMWYDMTIVNRAAFNITLAAGTDVTLVGATVIVKEGGSWRIHITSGTTVTLHNTANVELLGLTTNKIADLAVTTAKIEDLHVTTGKIAAAAVTLAKTTFITKVFAFDFAEIADGAFEQTGALAFAGVALGHSLTVGSSINTAGMMVHARVTAADEIRIWAQNETGAALNLAAADWTVVCIK